MTRPHSHPQSPVRHQHLPLLGLPSASAATSQTGGEAGELAATGLRAAHPPTQLHASRTQRWRGAAPEVKGYRTRVTWSAKGAGPRRSGLEAGPSAQPAAGRGEVGLRGLAHLRAPAGEGGSRDRGGGGGGGPLTPPTRVPSLRAQARTPRAQPIREHLARFPPSRRFPATRLVTGKGP